jgi:predicted dithiol-disulfide oxidoreductase (DUF899 family)
MRTTKTDEKAPQVVSHEEWLAARKQLLVKEKEFTRLRDDLSRQRREMPWERVEKNYVFEGESGALTLADLFDGRSQLFVYHFMLGPGWNEGCKSCSYLADSFDGVTIHLAQRDTSFVVISRATLPEIKAFKKRMGWKFQWVSSNGTDFNQDYQVSIRNGEKVGERVYYNYDLTEFSSEERPGASAFTQKDGEVFHTYSAYARGLDILLPTYNILDMTAKGRDEAGLSYPMEWVRHHDRYSDQRLVDLKKPG